MKKSSYSTKYHEIQVLGRGSFGVAYLVTDNQNSNCYYVAKKVFLKDTAPDEKFKSFQEVEILRKLNNPFIVKYVESFLEKDELIVIMEYCEEGDLSFYIGNHKKRKQSIPETVIANWLVQLSLGLKHIHENKILHRDIKTSNIFLNSNGTIKIGDFGISKVLETVGQSAHTFTGTPYYLSPEVCSSESYSFKSDIWALGCVVYELCTLDYAFQAGSLLGLVRKIVEDKVEKIPKIYSDELSNLVMRLLSKEVKHRPGIVEIFEGNYIKSKMKQFVGCGGKLDIHVPIKGTTLHESIKNESNSAHDFSNLQDRNQRSETPAEGFKRRKHQEAVKNEEILKKATREKFMTQQDMRAKKNEESFGGSNSRHYQTQRLVECEKVNKVISTETFRRKAAQAQKEIIDEFKADFPSIKHNAADDRPLPATLKSTTKEMPKKVEVKKKEVEQEDLQWYNDEDFGEYEEEDIRITAGATEGQLKQISDIYTKQLSNPSMVQSPLLKMQPESKPSGSFLNGMIQAKITELQQLLGKDTYQKVYSFILDNQKKLDESGLYSNLSKRFPKMDLEHFKAIDEIIFFEECRKTR